MTNNRPTLPHKSLLRIRPHSTSSSLFSPSSLPDLKLLYTILTHLQITILQIFLDTMGGCATKPKEPIYELAPREKPSSPKENPRSVEGDSVIEELQDKIKDGERKNDENENNEGPLLVDLSDPKPDAANPAGDLTAKEQSNVSELVSEIRVLNPDAPKDRSKDSNDYKEAAVGGSNPDALKVLSNDSNDYKNAAVGVSNPDAPKDLSKDSNDYKEAAVGGSNPDALKDLSRDSKDSQNAAVGGSNTDALKDLSNDSKDSKNTAVGGSNPDALKDLSNDSTDSKNSAVGGSNPDALKDLSRDSKESKKAAVGGSNPDALKDLSNNSNDSKNAAVGGSNPDALKDLSNNSNDSKNAAVGGSNPDAPKDLSEDSNDSKKASKVNHVGEKKGVENETAYQSKESTDQTQGTQITHKSTNDAEKKIDTQKSEEKKSEKETETKKSDVKVDGPSPNPVSLDEKGSVTSLVSA